MRKLCGIEAHGGNGSFEAELNITSSKYDALPTETKNIVSYEGQKAFDLIRHMIEIEWAKIHEKATRLSHIDEMTTLFLDAGFEAIHVKVIDNQYSGNAHYYVDPWLVVTTSKGPIMLGWRKRVINIDWSDSDIAVDGQELFKDEKTTSSDRYVHAWSKEKAVEYLARLRAE